MAIWDILQKAEQDIRRRNENTFSDETIQKLLEVRRQILEQVESRILTDATGKRFPYEKVLICFFPSSKELQEGFRVAFLVEDSLKADILISLEELGVRLLERLWIIIDPGKRNNSANQDSIVYYEMEFVKPEPAVSLEVPGVTLKISRGLAEHAEYCIRKERILIGRSSEVMDREGRVIRKNDVVFNDNGEDANSTVSYAHARIWWDLANQEFIVMDEVSRYGTCVVRDGRSLEVPAGNPCGIRLQSGDQIYCGRACLQFELVP